MGAQAPVLGLKSSDEGPNPTGVPTTSTLPVLSSTAWLSYLGVDMDPVGVQMS
jgi:hypothetical protein